MQPPTLYQFPTTSTDVDDSPRYETLRKEFIAHPDPKNFQLVLQEGILLVERRQNQPVTSRINNEIIRKFVMEKFKNDLDTPFCAATHLYLKSLKLSYDKNPKNLKESSLSKRKLFQAHLAHLGQTAKSAEIEASKNSSEEMDTNAALTKILQDFSRELESILKIS